MKFLTKKRENVLNAVRSSWGKTKVKYRNAHSIVKYYSLTINNLYFHKLSDQTKLDIDIDSLFEFIDRTDTSIGMQFLYSTLLHPTNDVDRLNNIRRNTSYFLQKPEIREKIQYELVLLEKDGCSNFVDIFTTNPETLKNYFVFRLLSFLSIILFIGSIFFPKFLFFLFLLMAFVNIAIHYSLRVRNENHYTIVRNIYSAILRVKRIIKRDIIPTAPSGINEDLVQLKSFTKYYNLLNFGKPNDDLSATVFFLLELVKGIFLIEIHVFNQLFNLAKTKKHQLLNIYEFIGETDMCISIASILADPHTQTCHPTLSLKEDALRFVNAYHPIIKDCQPNTLNIFSKSILLTGSNMSGKSSFLRTILINSILGQTIFLCFAESYTSPIVKQHSCILITDDILNAKSYYFRELQSIKLLIDEINNGCHNLFVIDEIFKGTNMLERLGLATNVLLYLISNKDFVIATTHDGEVADNLSNDFDEYYFSESIIDKKLHFDYKLKPGRVQTRNAIKLAKIVGYPEGIINNSIAMVNKHIPHN